MSAVLNQPECPVVLVPKEIRFKWTPDGKNNGHPRWKLNAYGHVATVYNTFDTKKWSALVDGHGTRNIATEDEAKQICETAIKAKVQAKIDEANNTIRTLAEPFWLKEAV